MDHAVREGIGRVDKIRGADVVHARGGCGQSGRFRKYVDGWRVAGRGWRVAANQVALVVRRVRRRAGGSDSASRRRQTPRNCETDHLSGALLMFAVSPADSQGIDVESAVYMTVGGFQVAIGLSTEIRTSATGDRVAGAANQRGQ
jgi:hypothetical protein